MDYEQTVEYLYNSTPVFEKIGAGAYKEGLYNTLALDSHLSHPHRHFMTIHVAGTNGKGSVSHTLSSILQSAGYRTGLFTSPHLVDFRERIRVNGQCVNEQYVIDFVAEHRAFFDCTNIITPVLSIITNISLDHTQFLGTTLPQIAAEKAGIIKPGIPVVIGEALEETRPVFLEKAQAEGSPIIFAEDQPCVVQASPSELGGMDYETSMGRIHGQLGGLYQVKNTNTILAAVEQLCQAGLHITADDVELGFSQVCQATGLMGRWQRIQEKPLVICDTGHNVGGWLYLSGQIKSQPCRKRRIVFGMVDDKDIDTVMDLLPTDAVYYFTKASSKRAIDHQTVLQKGIARGLTGQAYASVEEAYHAALADADPEDFIFVGGSSYVVADLLSTIRT